MKLTNGKELIFKEIIPEVAGDKSTLTIHYELQGKRPRKIYSKMIVSKAFAQELSDILNNEVFNLSDYTSKKG